MRNLRILVLGHVLLFPPALAAYAQRARTSAIEVRAADYSLILPDTIAAGTQRWTFANTGLLRHEMIIAKLAPSVDPHTAVDTLHARGLRAFFPGNPEFAVATSALFAAPGKKSDAEVVTRYRRGEVLLVFCQLRDADGKPKHDELGMFKVVQVR